MINPGTKVIDVMKEMADKEFSDLLQEADSDGLSVAFSADFDDRLSEARSSTRVKQEKHYIANMNKKIAALCAVILVFAMLCTSMVQTHATDNSDIYIYFDSYLKHIEARSRTYSRDRRFFSKKIKTSDRYILKNVPEDLELTDNYRSTSSVKYRWESRDEKHHLEFGQYDPVSFGQSLATSTVFVRSVDINEKIIGVQIYRNVEYGGGYIVWIYDGYCFMLSYTDGSEDEMLLHIQNDVVKE